MPHRSTGPLTRREIRAHKHAEKSRIRSSLSALRGEIGFDLDDLPEPGRAWKTPHKEFDIDKRAKNNLKHWRTKDWKRRTNIRTEKARQLRAA
ncbi:MAG: hypothetical protein V3V01_05465 [Acidimicrobiales bacterium]